MLATNQASSRVGVERLFHQPGEHALRLRNEKKADRELGRKALSQFVLMQASRPRTDRGAAGSRSPDT